MRSPTCAPAHPGPAGARARYTRVYPVRKKAAARDSTCGAHQLSISMRERRFNGERVYARKRGTREKEEKKTETDRRGGREENEEKETGTQESKLD